MPDHLRSKWTIPVFCVFLGLLVFGAQTVGGNPQLGIESFAVMLVFAVAVLLAGNSETIRGLRGDGRDERFEMLDLRATAYTGVTLIVAIIVAFLVEIARGHSGEPFTWLGAIGGIAYIVFVVILRLRS